MFLADRHSGRASRTVVRAFDLFYRERERPRPEHSTNFRLQQAQSQARRGFSGEKQPTTLRRLPSKSLPSLPTPPCSPGARGRLSRRSRGGASGVSRGVDQPVENRRRNLALFRLSSLSRVALGWAAGWPSPGPSPPRSFRWLVAEPKRSAPVALAFPRLFDRLFASRSFPDWMTSGRRGMLSRRCSAKTSFTRYCASISRLNLPHRWANSRVLRNHPWRPEAAKGNTGLPQQRKPVRLEINY
jgi:hypothetical protein